jgi:ribosomal protein S12
LCVSVCLVYSLFYGLKHRPCEALNAGPGGHPLASACCCSGIVTIVTATTPSNPNAAIMAIMAIDMFLSSRDEWFIFLLIN